MAEVPANRGRIEAEAIQLILSSDVWNSEAVSIELPRGTTILFENKDGAYQWKMTLLGDKVITSDGSFCTQQEAKLDARERLRDYWVTLNEHLLPPSQVD